MKLSGVLGQSRKVVAHLVGAEIGWATLSLQHGFGQVTFTEWIAQAILLATALGVYSIANDPASNESKATSGSDGAGAGPSTPSYSQPAPPADFVAPGSTAAPAAPIPTAPPEGWASTPAPPPAAPSAVPAAAPAPDAAPTPPPSVP